MNDRRRHFRLSAHLPLDIVLPVSGDKCVRRVSANVSAGGLYFQSHDKDPICPGQRINVRIAIPAAVGRLSTETALETEATVIRVDPIPSTPSQSLPSLGIACAFNQPLRFG